MFRFFHLGKNVPPASKKNPPPPSCRHVTCGAFPTARGCPVIELFAITCWRKRGVALHPFPLVEAYPRWNFLSGSCGPCFCDSDVFYGMPIFMQKIKLFREPWEEARTDRSLWSARLWKIMFRFFHLGQNVCPASKNPPPPFCCHVTCGAFPNARGCPVIELFAITCWRKRGVALHPFPLVEAYPRWNFLSGSCGPCFYDSDVFYAMPIKKSKLFREPWEEARTLIAHSIPRDYKIMFRIFHAGGQKCAPSLYKIHPPPFCRHVTCGAFPNARGCPAIELFAITCWRKRGVALRPFPLVEAYPRWNFLSGSCGPRFYDSDVSYAMPIDTIKPFREPWEEARTDRSLWSARLPKDMFRIFQVGKKTCAQTKKKIRHPSTAMSPPEPFPTQQAAQP